MRILGVLLIVTYRPEFEPQWIGRPYVAALNLNRLGEREIATLIDSVTGNKSLSERIRRDIIERTDGIPLFIEEMTKAVLEAESEGDARRPPPPFHSRLSRSPQAYMPRLWLGLTGSARLRRLRRSERLSGVSSLMRSWLQ